MYLIEFTRSAFKQYRKLPPKYQIQAARGLDLLKNNPQSGKPLKGRLKGKWKYRFSSYRILYEIEKKKLIVSIIEVRHRKDVYR